MNTYLIKKLPQTQIWNFTKNSAQWKLREVVVSSSHNIMHSYACTHYMHAYTWTGNERRQPLKIRNQSDLTILNIIQVCMHAPYLFNLDKLNFTSTIVLRSHAFMQWWGTCMHHYHWLSIQLEKRFLLYCMHYIHKWLKGFQFKYH